MHKFTPLNRRQIAQLIGQDLPDGAIVNLGIGMPTQVSQCLPAGREIILHSENGILGMGPPAAADQVDTDLIDASRTPITLLDGASITEHTTSFAMMRGGHLDYSILGGFQVAQNGDLANWITDAPDAIAAIGGAMDLAVGAKKVLVMMEYVTRNGEARLLEQCTYPLTGAGVVDRVYTDLAVIDITDKGFSVYAMLEGVTLDYLQERTHAPLDGSNCSLSIVVDNDGKPAYRAR